MAIGVAATGIGAVSTVALGAALGVSSALQGGAFAGALTSTPTLAAATAAAESQEPAVGYSLGYPIGVLVAIIVVAIIIDRTWRSPRDPAPEASQGLEAASVEVTKHASLHDVPGFKTQNLRMSYLMRGDKTRVIGPADQLQPGDQVVVVGTAPAVAAAIKHLGKRLDDHLADDRTAVDHRRFVISNRAVAGRSVAELDIPRRFEGVITRVRRGDLDLLAREDLSLELGDRILVVVPQARLGEVARFFGDSERKVSEVDAFTLGLGMAAGLLLGLVVVPLPSGLSFSLGAAAGPLLVGMFLGHVERTGPLIWGLPHAANLTTRQLGLMFFLAATGLSSGHAFAAQAFTASGATIVAASSAVALLTGAAVIGGGRLLRRSSSRHGGADVGT